MDYEYAPPPPELPDPETARQALHIDLTQLFPESDFWDRACALFLEDIVQAIRWRHGHVPAGQLLIAILEAVPPEWLEARLFDVVAHETYRRVLEFARTSAAAMHCCAAH